MKLTDLYDVRDLLDPEEALGRVVEECGTGLLDESFLPRALAHAAIPQLSAFTGGNLLEALALHGEPWQEDLVMAKMAEFDPSRLVILMGGRVIDGHHHLVAAWRLGRDVQALDLEEPAHRPENDQDLTF